MSLDVYLYGPTRMVPRRCDLGHIHEQEEGEELFSANITHNLNKMADAAGLYEALWRPEQIDANVAADLIPRLEAGLAKLQADPAEYRKLNPGNGWGNYSHLLELTRDYLKACKEHPTATIQVCR